MNSRCREPLSKLNSNKGHDSYTAKLRPGFLSVLMSLAHPLSAAFALFAVDLDMTQAASWTMKQE